MTQPTIKEVIEALRGPIGAVGNAKRKELANRIEAEGIAPKPYVPMTDDERNEMMAVWHENADLPPMIQYIEATVIKRAGLEIKHD